MNTVANQTAFVIDSELRSFNLTNLAAASFRFQSVWGEENLWKKFWTTGRFMLIQLDYSLSICMRESWLDWAALKRFRQLSRDRNLKFETQLLNITTEIFEF